MRLDQKEAETNWICCQLGAREHYAVPRALHQRSSLDYLITDTWVRPDSLASKVEAQPTRAVPSGVGGRDGVCC